MNYDGINKETLFLLADNKFRDSKAYYESIKEELKKGITIPMRQIASEISSEFSYLDELMVTDPVKMVSRIRRDTRFTKDKSMYRDNMWIMFMRDKHAWRGYPAFWFEVTPESYSIGVGIYGTDSAQMRIFREHIRNNTAKFRAAVKKCESNDTYFYGDTYKKVPDGCPKGLETYYSAKSFGFIKYSDDLNDLKDETIIGIIRKTYKNYAPMFSFLLEVADEYSAKGE